MRRALAGQVLRFLVWLTRKHQPYVCHTSRYVPHGYERCKECGEPWPCTQRRETDERVERFAR